MPKPNKSESRNFEIKVGKFGSRKIAPIDLIPFGLPTQKRLCVRVSLTKSCKEEKTSWVVVLDNFIPTSSLWAMPNEQVFHTFSRMIRAIFVRSRRLFPSLERSLGSNFSVHAFSCRPWSSTRFSPVAISLLLSSWCRSSISTTIKWAHLYLYCWSNTNTISTLHSLSLLNANLIFLFFTWRNSLLSYFLYCFLVVFS